MSTTLGTTQDVFERYEVRNYSPRSSKKRFHVWDHEAKREVFHTDNRERAEALVAIAGSTTITQHLKDHGHTRTPSDGHFPCEACRK